MIGERIGDYLKAHGIKQKFLVDKTGMSSNKISDICRGTRNIDIVDYFSICDALGVSLETFKEG